MGTIESSAESVQPVKWPLIGSLVLTSIVVALVCVPPFAGLHSWGRLVWLACVYILTAACVHTLAVSSIYRIQSVGVREWTMVWPVVWGAWIVVVWLPLVALLTYERSHWIVAIVPLAAVSLMLFLVWRRPQEDTPDFIGHRSSAPMLAVDDSPPLWRMLLPSLAIAVLLDAGVALYAANHAWMASVPFAIAAAYFAERLLTRTAARVKVRDGSVRRASASSSVTVWTLTVLALVPFLAGVGVAARGWMGMPAVHASAQVTNLVRRAARGYEGIILTRPKMPHAIVTPVLMANPEGFRKSRDIPFDGQYWFFQPPNSRPGPEAHVVEGDPAKSRISSTDSLPIVMEAHQRLAQPIEASCCRALAVHVVNADAVPGKITLEVLLGEPERKAGTDVRLGSKVLVSSTVSPMPLNRAPVDETLVFPIPRGAKSRSFDEITVKVVPERSRSLGAPQVAIKSFALER